LAGFFRNRKKNTTAADQDIIQKYLVQANYYLDVLEKRIRVYRSKLRKVNKIVRAAAQRGEKGLLIEALRSQKMIKRKLATYMGIHNNIQLIVSKIEDEQFVKAFVGLMKEGKNILELVRKDVAPDELEEIRVELEDMISSAGETEKIIAEPLSEGMPSEEDIEEEAEKLIAEASLPTIEEKETKKEAELSDLEKELKDILKEE